MAILSFISSACLASNSDATNNNSSLRSRSSSFRRCSASASSLALASAAAASSALFFLRSSNFTFNLRSLASFSFRILSRSKKSRERFTRNLTICSLNS